MKVLENKRKDYTVHLKVEVSVEEIDQAFDSTFKQMVKHAKVPGFRKGKVPRKIFEKHYGKEVMVQDAVMEAVNKAYSDALQETELKVVDYPKNLDISEYKENEIITFTCDVDVEPEVKLGKYKGVKVSKEDSKVDDDAIEKEINSLRESYGEYQETDEASSDGDIIRANVKATLNGEEYQPWSRENTGVKIGLKSFGEDFDTQIIGLKPGEKKSFECEYPADYSIDAIAGQKISFDIEMVEVRSQQKAELTDEFVQKVSDVKTVKELRDKIKNSMVEQQEKTIQEKLEADVIKEVAENAKVTIPQAMIDWEVNRSVQQFQQSLAQSGLNLDQYFAGVGKSVDEFKADMAPAAESRVKSDLVLEAVTKSEKIEANDDDLNEEIAKWQHETYKTLDDVKGDPGIDLEQLKQSISRRKTIDFLISNAKVK